MMDNVVANLQTAVAIIRAYRNDDRDSLTGIARTVNLPSLYSGMAVLAGELVKQCAELAGVTPDQFLDSYTEALILTEMETLGGTE